MIRRTTWRWMALVLVLAMVLTGCQPVQQAGSGGDDADMAGEEVVIAVGIEPVSLDAWRSFAGTGGPGYRFESEFHPDLRHDSAGILSMANAGGLATNGSQFFITFRETGFLDGLNPGGSEKNCAQRGVSCHSVFGKVTGGMDVVNNITLRDPSTATTPGDIITTIRIIEE